MIAEYAATITGIVFNNLNHNGVFNPGESGIPNVFVVLFSHAGGTCTPVQTDAGGNYSFTIVTPGTYTTYETVVNPGLTCPPTVFTRPAGFTMSNGPRKLTLTITNVQIVGNAVLGNNNFSTIRIRTRSDARR
ncbi:SdrD B-like domain-containing protein [Paenibacillus sp. OV219]|uniref:SdrD B-like domain-containing protein n=1 Tax=Paenibacillus sp. OV219 TaxID=1884377 RepID=UPI000A738BCF|nr:SdrD B-like domain-containing protein [Paenibacillus sp. OV219]